MSSSTAQMLPPKMAAEFCKLANEGKADKYIGEFAVFYRAPNQEINVIPDLGQGQVIKLTADEYQRARAALAKASP